MHAPTIVKQTKSYMLIKVPLPVREEAVFASPIRHLSKSERALLRVIQDGEKEYWEGKTVSASSIDDALNIYERRTKNKKD